MFWGSGQMRQMRIWFCSLAGNIYEQDSNETFIQQHFIPCCLQRLGPQSLAGWEHSATALNQCLQLCLHKHKSDSCSGWWNVKKHQKQSPAMIGQHSCLGLNKVGSFNQKTEVAFSILFIMRVEIIKTRQIGLWKTPLPYEEEWRDWGRIKWPEVRKVRENWETLSDHSKVKQHYSIK